jgi:hypothetical protein
MTFKPFKELTVLKPVSADGNYKLITSGGNVYAEVPSEEDAYRFADCWNALRKVAFPEAHINASEEYIGRLERLRKDAVSRSQELEAHIRALS